jgi:hypothetical protein
VSRGTWLVIANGAHTRFDSREAATKEARLLAQAIVANGGEYARVIVAQESCTVKAERVLTVTEDPNSEWENER